MRYALMLFVVFANLCHAQVRPVTLYRVSPDTITSNNSTDGFQMSFFIAKATGNANYLSLKHDGTNAILNASAGGFRFRLGGATKLELNPGGLTVTNSLTVAGGDVTIGDYMLRQGFSTANALYRPISGANTGVFGFSPNTNLGTEIHLYTHDRVQNSSDYGYYKIEADSTNMKFSQVSAGNVTVEPRFEFDGHVGIEGAPHHHVKLNLDYTHNVDADDIEWFSIAASPHVEATTSSYDAPYPVIIGRFLLAPTNTQDFTYSPYSAIGVEGAFRSEAGSSGRMESATALLSRLEFYSSTAIIENAYGGFFERPTTIVGTPVENIKGIYIQDFSGIGTVSSYNIYSAGSGLNHFNGNTTVGGTLVSTGNVTASANFGIGAAPTTDLDLLGQEFLIGGDNGTWTGRTNATTKSGFITLPHYTSSEENVSVLNFSSGATDNTITIGSQTSSFNAPTIVRINTAANNTTVTGIEQVRVTTKGVAVGTISYPTTSDRMIIFGTDSATVSGMNSSTAGIYADTVSTTVELIGIDGAGNKTTLTPHNFSMFTPNSTDEMPFSFYSRNAYIGKEISVNMYKLAQLVENLTGEQLVYIRDLPEDQIENWDANQEYHKQKSLEAIAAWEQEKADWAENQENEKQRTLEAIRQWEAEKAKFDSTELASVSYQKKREIWDSIPVEERNPERAPVVEQYPVPKPRVHEKGEIPDWMNVRPKEYVKVPPPEYLKARLKKASKIK